MSVVGVNSIYLVELSWALNEPNALEHLAEFLDIADASKYEMFGGRGRPTQFVSAFTYWLP